MRIMIGKIGEWFDHRLQLAAPIREAAEHPVPRNTASWFYVFGSAALTVFHPATGDRNSAGAYLCSLGGRSMEQPAGPESSGGAWLVHPRDAWMGLQLHGRHRPHSYGAGISVRGPQVPA